MSIKEIKKSELLAVVENREEFAKSCYEGCPHVDKWIEYVKGRLEPMPEVMQVGDLWPEETDIVDMFSADDIVSWIVEDCSDE